ncbi:MAG: peptide chain release factor N(5)-glutamine methyltransferase [Candidatus Omnitrophica bacterium]|nr:peptide chain release factor N(5)-glutamine methyltransferase [Candidatus Omnitrophota bacterium]
MSGSVLGVLKTGTHFLEERGLNDAQESSEELLSHLLRKTKASLYLDSSEIIPNRKQKAFFELIKKRSDHYPLQYLVGHLPFRHVNLEVKRGVFIPRPETECLVDLVLERIGKENDSALKILEIGTGTGCLALSLAHEIPNAKVVATDCSKQALALASKNARQSGVLNRIQFVETTYWNGISSQFDVVVSNPPYLSKRDFLKLQPEVQFEPKRALDGGQDGLRAYRYIAGKVQNVLKVGGLLAFEVGQGQAARVESMLQASGFEEIQKTKDLAGIERVVSARLAH